MQIRRTELFTQWLMDLKDRQGRARILTRIDRLEEGNPGNSRSVGGGVAELKIDFGPGYRVYYIQRGELLLVLLCGGDKSTQVEDVKRAKALAARLEDEE
jgi:putative addiction module killer protein